MVKHSGGALLPALGIDRNAQAPIRLQLAQALREMILTGGLIAGQRLPSSRTLAEDQGLSRTTVVDVYEQLAAEGLIVSRVGAGAFVADSVRPRRAPCAGTAPLRPLPPPRLAQLSADASEKYFPRITYSDRPRCFVTGTPALDAFPMALWARLAARHWRRPRGEILGYPPAGGLPALRRAIAAHLSADRGIACDPAEVFVFTGAQDAFNWIGAMLLDPGDAVWIENPGHIGARNALISAGAQLVPLPVDAEGLDVAAGLAAAPGFRLAFVTPNHQQPLGVTMTLARRRALLAAAEAAGAWIIEDDYVGELHYAGDPPPPLKSIDAGGRVIHVGSFAKTLFPALRIGFALAPPALVDVFERVAGATMPAAAADLQAVVARFIEDGHFAAHIRRMRGLYRSRQSALLADLARHAGDRLSVAARDTGQHVFAALAPGLDEAEATRRAAAAGLFVSPVGRYAIGAVAQRGLVLGFSAVNEREIAAGAALLAQALDGLAAAPAEPPRD